MMRHTAPIWALLICFFTVGTGLAADTPLVLDVWPGKPADDNAGGIGPEKFIELKVRGKPHKVAGKPTKWLTNVTRPTLTVYRPSKERNSGAAMLICPGGGYHILGWDVEGVEVAEWLNFGVRKSNAPCDAWTRTCVEWLRHQGVLKNR
ncbi:MAG TPA: hypothetical protein VMG10_13495 [Gemmataceae bacterium]|nr:hypothetical protein [Gemmataceae bacterium]